MNIIPGATKRLVIILWGFSMSVFLFYFSIVMELEVGIMKYFNFTILVFGGGVAYHVSTELIRCPQNRTNIRFWVSILAILGKVLLGFLISSISLLLGQEFAGDAGLVLMIFGLILGMLWSCHYLISLHRPIFDLVNATNIK